MKTVLCYGDSNTYGYTPGTGLRYPPSVRWTGRLRRILGEDYAVIEEGCNGRTTVFDDLYEPWKNGRDYLKPCLNTHKPVDFVIFMLGSNDLKTSFHASAQEIAAGAEELIRIIRDFTAYKQGFVPSIILISPPQIREGIGRGGFGFEFDESAVDRSKEFPHYFRGVAERNGCIFLDAALYMQSSPVDCLHLDPEAHAVLADKLAELILQEINRSDI